MQIERNAMASKLHHETSKQGMMHSEKKSNTKHKARVESISDEQNVQDDARRNAKKKAQRNATQREEKQFRTTKQNATTHRAKRNRKQNAVKRKSKCATMPNEAQSYGKDPTKSVRTEHNAKRNKEQNGAQSGMKLKA
jgi:hypothetical protein